MMAADVGELKVEVLIVEDTPASLALLSQLMAEAGYSVRQAQDGEMALMSVSSKLPDLILLDVHMPGIDGFEVCRRVKSDPKTADVPVIFMSALQDTEAKVKGFKLGAVDYIAKPYQAEEVLSRVKTHLELRTLQLHLEHMCDLRTRQLQAEIVERRNAEEELRESSQKLRDLTGHLQEVREQERTRIAREIHDELGQSLTAARIDLGRMSERLNEPHEQLKKYIDGVTELIDQASDTARSISENLRPGMLDLLGLGAAIEHHVARFQEVSGVSCELNMSNQGELYTDDRVAIAAFRILQESLTNVARHANALHVRIDVIDQGEQLVLVIQDDGQGIVEKPATKRRSYGLLGMSERAQLLGGTVTITSESGGGTRVEAILPLNAATPLL